MKTKRVIWITALWLLWNCTDPYKPPVSPNSTHALVVDGFINTSDSLAQVKLSRVEPLSSQSDPPTESNAVVSIEDNAGGSVSLNDVGDGTYSAKMISSLEKDYRIVIQTIDGKKYSSDFVSLLATPPIDSVNWQVSANGVFVNVNAHDPAGVARHYRWTFEETWKYNSTYTPQLELINGQIVTRPPDEIIHTCWKTLPSTQISIYSTANLSIDVVSNFNITFLPKKTEKLSQRYSIIVYQQTITEEAYNYWLQLQSTTQNLGGLFDALPSQVTGNVHCDSNPSEPVLGFFGGGASTNKRIFIDNRDLPIYLRLLPDSHCELDSIPISRISSTHDGALFVGSYGSPFPIGYLTSSSSCMDCRLEGGTSIQPSFWK